MQFSALKPAGERVLVKVTETEGKTTGGILLPTAAVTKKTEGSVQSVGTGKLLKVRTFPVTCSSPLSFLSAKFCNRFGKLVYYIPR